MNAARAAIWLVLLSSGALAGEPPSGPFRPATSGPLVGFTAPLPDRGRAVLQPILQGSFARGIFDADGALRRFEGLDRLQLGAAGLFAEVGILERLSLGGQISAVHTARAEGGEVASAEGATDAQLFARVPLLFERSEDALPATTAFLQVKAPTGNAVGRAGRLSTDVTGTGSLDLTAGLNLTKGLRPVLLHADVLYTFALPARIDEARVQYGGALLWSAACEWPFWNDRLALMVELSGKHQGAPRVDGVLSPSAGIDDVLAGLGVELILSPDLQVLAGWQRTVWGRNAPAFDSVVLTVVPVFF